MMLVFYIQRHYKGKTAKPNNKGEATQP